jgi:hypothetical protein
VVQRGVVVVAQVAAEPDEGGIDSVAHRGGSPLGIVQASLGGGSCQSLGERTPSFAGKTWATTIPEK